MRALLRSGLCMCGVLWTALPAFASEPPRWHLFFGSAGAERSMFGHAGFVWAPFGHLHESGWRIRGLAVAGTDDYQTNGIWIRTSVADVEILPGFHWMRPRYGITLSLGPTFSDTGTAPHDPGKRRQGTRGGAKLLAEGWVRLSKTVVLSGAASYATAHQAYAARLAARVELSKRIVLEPELLAFGEPGHDEIRLGLFTDLVRRERYRVSIGGGWAFDPDGEGPYAGMRLKMWR